jgi:hypothetical protein
LREGGEGGRDADDLLFVPAETTNSLPPYTRLSTRKKRKEGEGRGKGGRERRENGGKKK